MTLAWAAIGVAVGALAQSVSGIGFALVGGPLIFTVFGPREGVRVAVVLSMLVNVGVLVREHRAVMVRRGQLQVGSSSPVRRSLRLVGHVTSARPPVA